VNATLSPPTVTVKEIAMVEPYARVAVETNRLLNFLVALKLDQTNVPVSEVKSAPDTAPPRKKAGFGQKFGAMLRGILAANTNAAGLALAPKIAIYSLAGSLTTGSPEPANTDGASKRNRSSDRPARAWRNDGLSLRIVGIILGLSFMFVFVSSRSEKMVRVKS
jgi:hypothetical protein